MNPPVKSVRRVPPPDRLSSVTKDQLHTKLVTLVKIAKALPKHVKVGRIKLSNYGIKILLLYVLLYFVFTRSHKTEIRDLTYQHEQHTFDF